MKYFICIVALMFISTIISEVNDLITIKQALTLALVLMAIFVVGLTVTFKDE